MIKRTLYFGNPAYLCRRDAQLVVRTPQDEQPNLKNETVIPIEDIGVVILDNAQVTITQAALESLLENNVALITCDATHHPVGLMLPLDRHHRQSAYFQAQIAASEPLKKQLWAQTVKAKIQNQAVLLERATGMKATRLRELASQVRSGDVDNCESAASVYYWKHLFSKANLPEPFKRNRKGLPPNNLLNYIYAVLRAIVARGLVSSGLLPTLGIFHRNQYNAYCLADDIMEPYRPFADAIVLEIVLSGEPYEEITKEIKSKLLTLPVQDIYIGGERSPLMVGLQQTTASLARCFEGKSRKIVFPEWV
ncbi:MAG: type II CRISPR-associated endonuclease Cas1 [Cytophagales bacterium]|nr:type II CRISPR-associated endonuclease Cas1 [Cytophagales bacterium]MDW8384296.1 type II CRISPR-associated endonuclease Cas1 [Flammeovirgaceae bacterium]